jgi:1-deoxy-D-xylulose-5-phosphate reductoisomerase
MTESTKPRRIAILGSTGSIGTQALDVVRRHPDKLRVVMLSANRNHGLLAQQVREFGPDSAVLADADGWLDFKEAVGSTDTELINGTERIAASVAVSSAEIVLNSLVGYSGFRSTYESLRAGKVVALANKESLVVGGSVLEPWLGVDRMKVIPVDSEHSAILQCLIGEPLERVEKLILTASGGPFRSHTMEQMRHVTVQDALRHPNWTMGSKITIDSSTLMNKGLEVIEAFWLFGLPLERIEAVIHPQSIFHSMVQFTDGSVKAQLGTPDMKVPIQYALSLPDRWALDTPRVDWARLGSLTFQPVDEERFPCFRLAKEALRVGGYAPAVLNAANEVAVDRFLKGEIAYIRIASVVEACLAQVPGNGTVDVDELPLVDRTIRELAAAL